ncbi:MAG: hypothetical protein R3C05_17640 [Pirellulaceae bacterium]
MTALQFVLSEPEDWVEGNGDFEKLASELIELASTQLNWIRAKYHKPSNDMG